MSAEQLHVLDVSGLADVNFQDDLALDPRLPRQWRIFRGDLLDEMAGITLSETGTGCGSPWAAPTEAKARRERAL